MRILFDVQHPYYLPQYEPVMVALQARGAECFALAHGAAAAASCREQLDKRIETLVAQGEDEAINTARRIDADWVVVGNDNPYRGHVRARTALLYHGIGVKRVYYSPHLMNVDLRFVEGPYRERELARLYPGARLTSVGFPKLDPLVNGTAARFDLSAHGLDARRRTVVYAPTFFPSSIGRLANNFPARLADTNIIVKPHQFSLTNSNYRDHVHRFAAWQEHDNVFVADERHPSLVPFMSIADLLVSEASSALFEFAALDRPIVWCDFLKLRWSYRGPFRYRLRKRMDQDILAWADVGAHAKSPTDLVAKIHEELANPARFAARRHEITQELIGQVDGRAAERAADVLLES